MGAKTLAAPSPEGIQAIKYNFVDFKGVRNVNAEVSSDLIYHSDLFSR